ncbi:MAG: DNA-directed RNA polymerase subunit omega [Lachnospiraceae bacterium]|nr:DNA-directed RNA polymerase subunit omega [Lachnospiraceae bacterium]
MLHPSYADLMKVVNSDVEEGDAPVVSSRYSIVMATSKRARQIISGDEVLVENYEGRKPLSAAIEELNQAKIRILSEDEALSEVSEENEAEDTDTVSEDSVEEPISNGEE